jgi:predicted enzyme related to lactoylglutathione lyase
MINGGFYQKNKSSLQFPSFVIAVDDITAHLKIVEKAGGKILGNPVQIPNVGWYVSFIDTEGNQLSMLQPVMKK